MFAAEEGHHVESSRNLDARQAVSALGAVEEGNKYCCEDYFHLLSTDIEEPDTHTDRRCSASCGQTEAVGEQGPVMWAAPVAHTLLDKVKPSCLLARDGAPAFRSAAKRAGLHLLKGVTVRRRSTQHLG